MQPFSDEDASVETMSHCSGFSDPASFNEDGMSVFGPIWKNASDNIASLWR